MVIMAEPQPKPPGPQRKGKKGSSLSRVGLQMVLIIILTMAALSLIALGMLKGSIKPTGLTPAVKTRVTGVVEPPWDLSPEKPSPAVSTQEITPTPEPSPAGEKDSGPLAEASAQNEKAPPASAPEKSAAKAPDGEKPSAEVPKPLWQTLDQEWDKVKVGQSADLEDLPSQDAPWKQLNVGQTEKVRPERPPEPAASPTPDAKPAEKPPAAKPVASAVSPQTSSKPKPKPAPATLRLALINESGRPDQSAVYREVLQAMGYSVVNVEERVPQPGPTKVLYGDGLKDKALTLVRRLPGSRTLAPITWKSDYDVIIMIR